MYCPVCGAPLDKVRYGNTCSHDCFIRQYWRENWKRRDKHIYVNKYSYQLMPEDSPDKGCDGMTFYLKDLRTGEVFKTTNLWMQGEIPEEFKPFFENTHVFLNKIQYETALHNAQQGA